jgi:ribosomal protein S27AE
VTEPTPQRAYRAACPNCGAPVEFRSPASAFAVCSYCASQIVRDGESLARVGKSADLFDDHSPLQLGAAGRANGAAFTLVGRLQYRYAEGTWNEWHALFDNGRSAWLSEDNGRYVLAFDQPLPAGVPSAERLRAGGTLPIDGRAWSIASVVAATLIAAQGELPAAPRLKGAFVVADLRNPQGEVGTLDYSDPAAPVWSIGRAVALSELAMTGLAAVAEKTLSARNLACPSCGNAVEVKLETTQSVVCGQCHAVIDVSKGVGADLGHYAQEGGGAEPQIPLGSVGTLALGTKGALPWQVVGYAERCDVPESDDDEQTFWREYLLYHRSAGFAFLVDAEDGWSWVAPITGAPEGKGDTVRYAGVAYRKKYSYKARVTWVLGEFYWKVSRGQETENTDYEGTGSARAKRLNREDSRTDDVTEVVWSAGEALDAEVVRKAFRLAPEAAKALARDASPGSGLGGPLLRKILVWAFIAVIVFILFRCDSRDCDSVRQTFGAASKEYQDCLADRSRGGFRSGGGSFGGGSSGGSHK